MRHVELSKIALQSAMRLRPLAPGRTLVDSLSGPLVFALDEPGRKALVMGFDLFKADLSRATVVALYISPGVMTRLKPVLLGLKPGTRVVSHHFTLEDWEPDETLRVENRTGYLWVVPADVRGAWTVELPGDTLAVRIDQTHQQLRTTGERGGKAVPVIGARLRGTEIEFSSFDPDGASRQFRGRLEGNRIIGSSSGQGVPAKAWTATRR